MSVSKEEFEELKQEIQNLKLLLVTAVKVCSEKSAKGVLGELDLTKNSMAASGITLDDFRK